MRRTGRAPPRGAGPSAGRSVRRDAGVCLSLYARAQPSFIDGSHSAGRSRQAIDRTTLLSVANSRFGRYDARPLALVDEIFEYPREALVFESRIDVLPPISANQRFPDAAGLLRRERACAKLEEVTRVSVGLAAKHAVQRAEQCCEIAHRVIAFLGRELRV